jgi:hypothetical protein
MGLELGDFTGPWVGRDGGWEPVEGVAHIELGEEWPVEEPSPAQTEFTITRLAHWVPACPSGRHRYHPGDTCGEHEAIAQSFQDFLERLFAAAYAQAEQTAMDQFIDGFATWEPQRLLASLIKPYRPTPIERALEILGPHLAREPLYQPKARVGHWLPDVTQASPAVSEQQPSVIASDDRPAWQSPYGPPPRRR